MNVLRAMRRSWWLVIVTIAIAMGFAWGLTAITTPKYATSVTFFVGTPGNGVTDAYQGSLFSQQRVKSYSALLGGERLARIVSSDRSLGLTSEQVQQRVSSRVLPDTVLLQVTVTDPDPARAEAVAGVLAEQFITLVESLETPLGGSTPAVKVEVVSGPVRAADPVSPRLDRNLMIAVLLGLILGAAAAVLRDLRDTSIKSAEVLSELAGTPALAVVPLDATAKRRPLITASGGHSSRAESLRRLRTNLQFADVDRPVKVVTVTSATAEEGKSTTAVNLAIAFAEAGSQVLLVDADLRRPRIADYLDMEGAVGLSNVLAGQVPLGDVLQPWGDDQLWVLPCGFIPPNPSELLGSTAMTMLIARLRANFDVVIIDTPPLLPVTDGALVAAKSDGVVLVTRSRKTGRTQVSQAVAALSAVDARMLGCVLNMQPGKADSATYYHRAETRKKPRGFKWRRGRRPAPVAATPVAAAPAATRYTGRSSPGRVYHAGTAAVASVPAGSVSAAAVPVASTPEPLPEPDNSVSVVR